MENTAFISTNTLLKLQNDTVITSELKKEKGSVAARLRYHDLVLYSFKLPKASEEELRPVAEIKFYEEAGLNLNKTYKTHYLFRDLKEEDNVLIEAIAVDEEILKSRFKSTLESVKYIDFIVLPFLVYESFYRITDIPPKRDAFIYVEKEEAFVTIYENGKYLYAKSLQTVDSLLKSVGISYEEFIALVGTRDTGDDPKKEDILGEIDKFFSDLFMKVNNVLSYGRSVFYLEGIDRIYFYTPFVISEFEAFKSFWELSQVEFEHLRVEENTKVNQFDLLSLYHVSEASKYDKENLTIFHRPAPFYKREIGKLALTAGVFFVLMLGDYYLRYDEVREIEESVTELQSVHEEKTVQLTKVLSEIKKLKQENDALKVELSHLAKENETMTQMTEVIKKQQQDSLQKEIASLSKLLYLHQLKITALHYDQGYFTLGVVSKEEKREEISAFMSDVLLFGYKDVNTTRIENGEKSYYSEIRIVR